MCRFISGIWGSNAISLVGGTITDLFTSRDLGLAMSAFSWSAFAFTGVGPMAFGYVEQNLNFRYVNWIMFALSMAFAIFVAVISRETRASALLSRKAKKLRKTTGLDRYQCRADAERASLAVLIKVSLFRPLRLLLTEPVLIAFGELLLVSLSSCMRVYSTSCSGLDRPRVGSRLPALRVDPSCIRGGLWVLDRRDRACLQ